MVILIEKAIKKFSDDKMMTEFFWWIPSGGRCSSGNPKKKQGDMDKLEMHMGGTGILADGRLTKRVSAQELGDDALMKIEIRDLAMDGMEVKLLDISETGMGIREGGELVFRPDSYYRCQCSREDARNGCGDLAL
ncbi:MAG: hypothetical protein MUO63_23030 [Desulfobulbaceae bacterium]|nr:hypothetical protein [Desulfobulbaceae bacterium]